MHLQIANALHRNTITFVNSYYMTLLYFVKQKTLDGQNGIRKYRL